MKIKKFIQGELKGWKLYEVLWLAFCTFIILILSIYCKDNIISIIGALTGIWCTILTGKGKRSAFIFGIVNILFYSYISYKAQYYGEVMLNSLYFLPMNVIGFIAWSKHLNKESYEIEKNKLTQKKKWLTYSITAVGIFVYGFVLKALGGNLPFTDSMSTVISITAQILSVKRLKEQWVLWIAVDAVTVVMWATDLIKNGDSIAMLIMWSLYLANGIAMYIKWNKK